MDSGRNIEEHVEDVVHAETQRHEDGFDLTAAAVSAVTGPGRVDFGGGELAPAETDPVETGKCDPDDDYGWWDLDAGTYLLSYNERLALPAGERLVLQPRDALLARGATHPTLFVSALQLVPLSVGGAGLRVKENARVSTLVAP